jgi:cysteine desulfurase
MVRLTPIIYGGGHERGFRSGSLNVPGIVGMAEALKLATQLRKTEKERLKKIRDQIYSELKGLFHDIKLNGHPEERLAHNLNITIPRVEAKALIHKLRGKLSISIGSACSTVKVEPSYVLKAIGLSDDDIYQTIRIGLGRFTEGEKIPTILIDAIKDIREKFAGICK